MSEVTRFEFATDMFLYFGLPFIVISLAISVYEYYFPRES